MWLWMPAQAHPNGGWAGEHGQELGDARRPAGIFNSLKFPLITCTSETLQGSLLIGSS